MMLNLALDKTLDAICVGRAGMDLYATEHNTDFNDVTSFQKHVGGSPANIAIGMAKLGSKVGFVGKVSDDVVGQYVQSYLQSQHINTHGISVDNTGTRTSLALTEMRQQGCAVVIYRNNAADLALEKADIDEQYIASARLFIVSGTALSAEPSRSAVLHAMRIAHEHQVKIVLDLDYRAYTWQSNDESASVYQQAAALSHVLIGNNEEFEVMGLASKSPAKDIAQHCLNDQTEAVLVKAGEHGSSVFTHQESFTQASFNVTAIKPFGAGDAYAAAICAGLAVGLSWPECVQRGAAAAAIVVAGTACGAASPDEHQLATFLATHTAETQPL